MQTLQLPKKTEYAIRWLFATLQGQAGPGHPEFPVPLRHLLFKGGRGSAKSHTVARIVAQVIKALGVRCLCTRETQKSIEESVYQLLGDVITEMGYDDDFEVLKQTIQCRNGGQAIFAGLRSQDINKLKSTERILLAWVEEAHVVSERSLEILGPTIREENSVIIYTYNPELEDDPVHERYTLNPAPDVCVVELNWRDNPWFPQVLERERLADYDRDKTKDRFKYKWIWEGKTLPAVEGAIFAEELARFREQGRVRPVEYDSRGRVHVVMDLGFRVMTAVLVQRFASTIQVVGYYEMYRSTYEKLTKELRKLDYKWGKVFMPHDAAHREPRYGKNHKERMEELGWEVEDIPQVGVENYIESGREMFNNAYITDSDGNTEFGGCKQLLRCLQRWRYKITETSVGTQKYTAPEKDDFSHGGEAWCYTAVVAEDLTNDDSQISNPYEGFDSGYAA